MTNLIKRREQFISDQRSLYMDEWQLYWVCFSRQDIRECLAATNERLNYELWANQRTRAGLWTGYASGGGGRDELMSGFCHLIGHKGSINVSDWFSDLQLPINLHALKACIHNLLLLHVNICLLFWIHKKILIADSLKWICLTWYNLGRWICCIHQAVTADVTITRVSVADWVTGHKQKQQNHLEGHSHPHWSEAQEDFIQCLSCLLSVHNISGFMISFLRSTDPSRSAVSSRLLWPGVGAQLVSLCSLCQLSVTSDWLSHQADQHWRQMLHYGESLGRIAIFWC